MSVAFSSTSAVTKADFDAAAEQLGVTVPPDYAAFLLEHNGGVPNPNILPRRGDDVTIEQFYSLHSRITARNANSDLVRMTLHFRSELDLPESLLPIALADGVDILVLTVTGRASGRVSLWSMIESGYDPDRVHKIADSFGKLLARLDRPVSRNKANRRQQLEALDAAVLDGDLAAIRELVPLVDLGKPVPDDVVHPVHRAVIGGKPSVLKALHAAGLNFRAKYDGVTPARLAKKLLREAHQTIQDCKDFGMPQAAKPAQKDAARLEKTLTFLAALRIK